jgi:5'-nucleotidase (lipoprotein e(P4) family)
MMRKIQLLIIWVAMFGFASCVPESAPVQVATNNDNLLVATLYHQRSAERNALCLQAYNVAKYRLDEILKENPEPSKLAIVLDLDETVLDNSPYEAKCILENINYPQGWDEWINAANAISIPGALDFLKYTKDQGVNIFYISNRREKFRQATLQNLKALGISPASDGHLLLRKDESTKEPRRQTVLENHEIVMLFGDNLADFSKIFDGEKSTETRAALADSLKSEFGSRFIVFPNAMYGDWLNAVTDYNFSLAPETQLKKQKEALIDVSP